MSFFHRYTPPGPLKPKANPYPSRIYPFKHKLAILTVLIVIASSTSLYFFPHFYANCSSLLFEGAVFLHTTVIHPFQRAFSFLKASYTLTDLKNDHARLLQENKALKWKLQALAPLHHENIVLKQQLNVSLAPSYRHSVARVLSSPSDGLYSFFLIAAGANQNLQKNQAVLSPEGVLGRVEKVGKSVSRVLLLTDVNSRIPVMTELSQQKAILAGDRMGFPVLVYVTDVQKIRPGERVVTSGVGGVFPPGLPVGRIRETSHHKIHVHPFASPANLEWVHVLHPQPPALLEDIKNTMEEE